MTRRHPRATRRLLIAAVAAQRVAELRLSRRHERELRRRGAVEYGAGHFPVMVALHAGWLAAAAIESGRRDRPVRLLPLAVFLAVQPLRVWVIRSLGARWTTRVLVVPGEPPVRHGPYRWLRHPNYAVVVVEIATLPLALGAVATAAVGSLANAALLARRITVEDAALAGAAA